MHRQTHTREKTSQNIVRRLRTTTTMQARGQVSAAAATAAAALNRGRQGQRFRLPGPYETLLRENSTLDAVDRSPASENTDGDENDNYNAPSQLETPYHAYHVGRNRCEGQFGDEGDDVEDDAPPPSTDPKSKRKKRFHFRPIHDE